MTLDDAISRLRALATIADTGTLSVVQMCPLSVWDAEAMREAIRVMERDKERGCEVTYTIKPLAWTDTEVASHADTLFGRVWASDGLWWKQSFVMYPCNSRDHGKQLAWEWYVAKLSEALEPVTQPP